MCPSPDPSQRTVVDLTVPADALAAVVSRRRDFLDALASGPRSKPALVEATGTSRSTVDRAIDALQEEGLVTRDGGTYELTLTGRYALREFDAYRSRLDALQRAHDVLGVLPSDAAVEPDALVDADVEESPHYPNDVAFRSIVDLIREGDRLRAVGPALPPRYIGNVDECVARGDLAVEFVMTGTVLDMIGRVPCEDLRRLARRDAVTVYELDERVPYALWIVESETGTDGGLVVYTDSGVKGIVRNDTDAMTEWAGDVYEEYRARAEPRESIVET